MPGPAVDFTINIGTIIEIAVLAAGGIATIVTLRNTVSALKKEMDSSKAETKEQFRETKEQFANVQDELKKLGEILVDQARFDERLTNLDKRVTAHGKQIDELRHGQGFVRGGPRASIDGEYGS